MFVADSNGNDILLNGNQAGSRTAFVTVTYNGVGVWQPFYECLLAQNDANWMLVVVDNNSTDGIRDVLLAINDPRVTLILNTENLGVAAANNQGIKVAIHNDCDHICLINNDVEFNSDLLRNLRSKLEDLSVDAISPLIPFFDAPDRVWYGGGSFSRKRGVMVVHDHEGAPLSAIGSKPFITEYAPTCCVLFKRSVFEKIGLMDEKYFVYWDDTDFLWRMKQAGMRILVDPSVVLLHKVSSSTGGRLSDFTIRYVFRNQILFTRKFHGTAWALYSGSMAMLSGLIRIARNGDTVRHLSLRARAIREGFSMPRT